VLQYSGALAVLVAVTADIWAGVAVRQPPDAAVAGIDRT